ncbi:MAG: class I SAM-dependent methyltransferase [Alphaproteobacteria bacterium]|nr:class I SAM-dependent methyltransferase [Alphaproteobacteria bacterium]
MLVCPACSAVLSPALGCADCGWRGEHRDGLPVLLSAEERDDATARSYTANYDRIARDDLDANVMDERYIENLSANFCEAIELPPRAEICDIGSGKGFLVRRLLARGAAHVTAVDISLPYLARMVGEPGVSPVLANAESLPFVEHFDVIVATDVLEHVLNVGSFLYSANRALRPGGFFYVRVPYRENLLSYSPHLGCPYRFVHLRTYDRPLLRQALEEAGFAVERMWLDGYMTSAPRRMWTHGGLRQRLYRWFEQRLHRPARHPADATLRKYRLPRVFLRPTVIIAAARKRDRVMALPGGGFRLG